MPEGVILTPCIEMLRKIVCGQKAMILFLCFEAEIQFKKPIVFLKQLEGFSASSIFAKALLLSYQCQNTIARLVATL